MDSWALGSSDQLWPDRPRSKSPDEVTASIAICFGPSGSGKTVTVYTAAREMGFHVLELNANHVRSGSEIRRMGEEALQSHRLGSYSMTKKVISPLFCRYDASSVEDGRPNY